MKIGRNEPCPCGSGKKHKRCCLRKDEVVVAMDEDGPRGRSLESRVYRRLVEELMNYLGTEENNPDLVAGLLHFFDGLKLDETEALSSQEVFHSWYMSFWINKQDQNLIERFIEHKRSLSAVERKVLESIPQEPFRIMEVLEVRLGSGLTLKDIFSNETFEVLERGATETLVRWDLILTKLRRFQEHNELDMAMGVNRKLRDAVTTYVNLLVQSVNQEANANLIHVGAMTFGLPEVFKLIIRQSREVNKPPRMVNSEGDDIALCRAHFTLHDKARVIASLRRHMSFDESSSDDGFRWLSGHRHKTAHGYPGKITLGQVIFKQKELILETNSLKRLKKGKLLLEKNLGEWLTYKIDSFEDIESPSKLMSNSFKDSDQPQMDPALEAQVLPALFEQYYLEQWINTPVPMLGGKTPLAASKDGALRARLKELLKDIENQMSRPHGPSFDVSLLWKKLNLSR
jgi:SEC-C motif